MFQATDWAERGLAKQIKAEEMEAKNRKQEMKKIREKQTEESALSSLNIASSPVQIKFIHASSKVQVWEGGGSLRPIRNSFRN